MTKCAFIPNFLRFYNILWQAALPFLRRNQRLAPSFDRRLGTGHLEPANIWVQAASAGEAFLALSILRTLAPDRPLTVLVTTTTDQGLEILENGIAARPLHPNVTPVIDRFPFDVPGTVQNAVRQINPDVMVLLETELWPALLHALKQNNTRILVLNARMSSRSFRHYRATRFLWRHLAPDHVLAISPADARRWAGVFFHTRVSTMENIKFDIMDTGDTQADSPDLSRLFPGDLPLSVLASVRRAEEPDVIGLVKSLKNAFPEQIVAIFPRHMHRIAAISDQLKKNGIAHTLRSELAGPVTTPTVILWDRFGELRAAYAHAATVFVGGSLKRLGGQNFIEPAVFGIPTVTGPFWDDFAWVGSGIFDAGIVTRCAHAQEVAGTMVRHLETPPDMSANKKSAHTYIREHQGGSAQACRAILRALPPSP